MSAVTSGFCFTERIGSLVRVNKGSRALLCAAAVPLSALGFSRLISLVYPAFGFLGLFMVIDTYHRVQMLMPGPEHKGGVEKSQAVGNTSGSIGSSFPRHREIASASAGPHFQRPDLYGKIICIRSYRGKSWGGLLKHIPDEGRPAPGERAAGIITALMLFLCIAAVAVFSWQRSLDPTIDLRDTILRLTGSQAGEAKAAEVQYSFAFDTREKPGFALYKGNIVKCSKSGMMFLDKKGVIQRSEGIGFDDPIVKTNGSRLLAVNAGSTEICVLDGESIRWQDRTDDPILNAEISDDGYVTVVTSAKRDNNVVRVYEQHGIELFRKIIATDFAVSAGVSPSKKHLVLSAVATGAVGPYSRYRFFDMEGRN